MRIFFIIGLFACLLFTSCHSSKQLVESRRQREALSEKLGFEVTKKDDLRLYSEVARWLGVPYRYGGSSRSGVDCSGFVNQVYKQVYRQGLARTTEDIVKKNCRKVSRNRLRAGDLVFFNTSKKRRRVINHVGLFLKEGYFVHASSSKGVVVSRLDEEYYKRSWKQGGRVR